MEAKFLNSLHDTRILEHDMAPRFEQVCILQSWPVVKLGQINEAHGLLFRCVKNGSSLHTLLGTVGPVV